MPGRSVLRRTAATRLSSASRQARTTGLLPRAQCASPSPTSRVPGRTSGGSAAGTWWPSRST
eukprot:15353448-Alexandrium_andersonii.AAC.1